MKFKKVLSLLLTAAMLSGMASFAAQAASAPSSTAAGNYYNADYLESYANSAYNESGLGSVYSKDSTTWKTWSPEATSVKLKLYKTGSDSESGAGVIGTYDLTKDSTTGIWSITLNGDYKDVYYTYIVDVNGSTNETQDVYSKATGVNGNRSMVVDLDSTDPEGWDSDEHVLFDSASQAVVWEVHVRDFSASDTSGVSKENQGKYLAFAEGGTKLNSSTDEDAVSTGIDYLVEQGINCVQLMPVYDFQSVDETAGGSSSNRNWGYDPQNYNVPEGSYSSNPYDGNTRITEFKQMIQALHDRGISVVMDVVYNHTYTTEGSCFSKTVPGYYYRMNSASVYSNGSGCGNETASDKLMYRKYMIDSVKYWADEYHIDGFRFDLMGIHDITTMNTIRSELDNLYADGSGQKILMYGEPWTGGTVAISDGCSQSKASALDARVGMFCDSYRDAIKGGTNDASKGYVQGDTSKTYTVVNGVQGKGFGAKAPSQTIAYADAHDNLILWDKIVKSNGSSSWDSTSDSYKGQLKEAMTLVMTSQGIPFMTAGTEFCRTKQGDHNSYQSSDSINAIDWTRVQTYADVAAYYKGLLQIRDNYSPMTSSAFSTPSFQSNYGYVVAYTYTNNKSDEWGKVCVLVNSGTQGYTINLAGSGWTIVADGKTAGLKSLGTVSGSSYTIGARSTAVLVESSTFDRLQNAEPQYGTLTINHTDESGKVLKTSTAKYEAGSTYRAIPDSTILYDYNLVDTIGTVSGTVEGGQNYEVTFVYSATGIESGYLTVKYVDSEGTELKDATSYHLRTGDSYEIPYAAIQGYQLDTDKYPAQSYGTFDGSDKTITFVYKDLDNTSSVVHYYNSNNWSSIRCYAYTSAGDEPNGNWDNATIMTNEGNGWFVCTVPAASAYVIFHPVSGTTQEPGQGETGYAVSGEAWIQNKQLTFSSKVITSHIDIATGQKLAADVVDTQSKTTSSASYTTTALQTEGDVIVPANASGNYASGITNVVYLYTSGGIVTTPTQETTKGTEPIGEKILIGDTDFNGKIAVGDATLIQKAIVGIGSFDEKTQIAADTDKNKIINIKDATQIQRYLADYDAEYVGTYYDYTEVVPTEPTTAPTTAPTTEPTTQPTTQPTTEPATQPTTQAPEPDTYTITLTNSLRWGNTIYCYYWSDDEGYGEAWPGTAMTYTGTNDYGEALYTVEVPSSAEYIIFNNGSSQTVNIPFDGSELRYYVTSSTDGMGHYQYGTW